MHKLIMIAAALAATAFAQSLPPMGPPGTVTATQAVPATPAVVGRLVATTATVSCTMTGNASPATTVSIACAVGGMIMPTINMPMPAGHAYTFQHNWDQDAVTVLIQSDAAKVITVRATANGSPEVLAKF
jgi:hypothetical protein